jgi:hypothetical protein
VRSWLAVAHRMRRLARKLIQPAMHSRRPQGAVIL